MSFLKKIVKSIAGPLTGGLIDLGGSMLSANQSADEANKQMEYQSYMSNTAHQREVADLKAAGLNPILSAFGSGASTPSGAMGNVPDYGASLSQGANSAMQAMQLGTQIKNMKQNTKYIRSQKRKSDQEAINLQTTRNKINTENESAKLSNEQQRIDLQLKKMAMELLDDESIQNDVRFNMLAQMLGLPPGSGILATFFNDIKKGFGFAASALDVKSNKERSRKIADKIVDRIRPKKDVVRRPKKTINIFNGPGSLRRENSKIKAQRGYYNESGEWIPYLGTPIN